VRWSGLAGHFLVFKGNQVFYFDENLLTSLLTGKRKQALLESNLPGISCSTGMVTEVGGFL
jgi:hypothetical protein